MTENFHKKLIIGISLIAGGFLAFGIIAYFVSGMVAAEAQNISLDRNMIRNHSDLIEGLAKQKSISPEVEKFAQAIDLILPPKDQLVNFSSWLDSLSRARNVSVNFNFGGETVPANGTDAGYIRFTLNISGDYAGVTDFLRDIELKSPKYTISFDDFDLKRNGVTDYRIITNGRVFFR
ncbi:MAG: hypothetical protein Q7K44_04905 [Candidatus Liptonbacteria bacterium]|nr:hypothetical protein [Candidatus Liptonbacteria bacterium]